jgi:hypothetical protein
MMDPMLGIQTSLGPSFPMQASQTKKIMCHDLNLHL